MTTTLCAPMTDLEIWREGLRDLLDDCAGSTPLEEASRIREAARMFEDAQSTTLETTVAKVDFARLEQLLAADAMESAVLSLLGPKVPFMLSRGNGSCLATVLVPEEGGEVMAEAATMALALLAAYVSALLAGCDKAHAALGEAGALASVRLH